MTGFLRYVGLFNAAVWFGAAVGYAVCIAPVFSSAALEGLLGPKNFPYFSVAIGHVAAARFYHLCLVCGVIALLHLGAEWIYLGKTPKRRWVAAVLGLFCIALFETAWLQPKLSREHGARFALNSTAAERAAAAKSFALWLRVSQGLNVLSLGGLGLYLWRVGTSAEPPRFVIAPRFRS